MSYKITKFLKLEKDLDLKIDIRDENLKIQRKFKKENCDKNEIEINKVPSKTEC